MACPLGCEGRSGGLGRALWPRARLRGLGSVPKDCEKMGRMSDQGSWTGRPGSCRGGVGVSSGITAGIPGALSLSSLSLRLPP